MRLFSFHYYSNYTAILAISSKTIKKKKKNFAVCEELIIGSHSWKTRIFRSNFRPPKKVLV